MQSLIEAQFSNEIVTAFPGDRSGEIRSRQTPGAMYSLIHPTPVKDPQLIAWSEEMARELGLQRPANSSEVGILGGNKVTASMEPYAACYAGHQFGNWAGQLGDGRAIVLGELIGKEGRSWEIQLKGAGQTPYSRRADGRAVLRSSVREYLMSEAMHYLGVPTTRALARVSTGEKVLRDMFYDGNPEYEPGAIVTRVAPSFLRFGNYEMLAARKELDNLKKLVAWTIDRHYPHIQGSDRVLEWFKEVADRTAFLMAEWMRVGFVHGVMNTDNMSILGLTIDHGPYSFLDDYDLDFTPNTTDLPGRRYAFGRQASIAQWNLGALAGAISLLLPDTSGLLKILEGYRDVFLSKYHEMMGRKLGLDQVRTNDQRLFQELESILNSIKPDMTIFHQLLIGLPDPAEEWSRYFEPSFYSVPDTAQTELLTSWLRAYQERLSMNSIDRQASREMMRSANPRVVLRNYQLHEAIEDLENGDDTRFRKLEAAMRTPYSSDHDDLVAKRPAWATSKAGCSMLSCSS